MMRNAKTKVREMPYLMNATSSPFLFICLQPGTVSEIEDDFLRDYPNLYGFRISGNPIKKISMNTFKGVERIRVIQIMDCPHLAEIEGGAFDNMVSLEYLLFVGNNLTTIEANMFQDLISLNYLDLVKSPIHDIHKHAFSSLTNLERIWLYRNKLTSLDSEIFTRLMNLMEIDIDWNPLSYIPRGIFNHSKKLETIQLKCGSYYGTDCQNTNLTLEKGSLATSGYAQIISVDGCISILKPCVFEGVNTNKLLIISNNKKLSIIRRHMFEGAKAISHLILHNNGIETIENDSFSVALFNDLLKLDLSFNKLQIIQRGTFDELYSLNLLDLSANLLTTITSDFFQNLDSLTHLFIAFNKINHIHANAFSSLGQLCNLSLRHNQITNLSHIPIQNLLVLEHLDVSANKIRTLTYDDFFVSQALKTILLHQNRIRKMEDALGTWSFLELVDLSHNALTIINGSFSRYMKVNKLILSNNSIGRIGDAELFQREITELHLDRNKINDVNFILNMERPLNYLDLSFNKISEVSNRSTKKLQMIKNLKITDNLWKCSCKVTDRELMHFLSSCDIFPCCPESCKCSLSADKSVFVNCESKNKRSLPICLPHPYVKVDYTNNSLQNLSFTKYQENITHLNLLKNEITMINGSTLSVVKNQLTHLNLRWNHLNKLPEQMIQLSTTKIYLEGNKFLCSDCHLVNILETINQTTPQNIQCEKHQSLMREYILCLFENKVVPYVCLNIVILVLLMSFYLFCNWFFIKRLGQKYQRKSVRLNSRKVKEVYGNECAILKKTDHHNIIKMYKNMRSWTPFVNTFGHLFFENVECTLGQALKKIVIPNAALNVYNLSKDLISAISYLHSREHPIYHKGLNLDTIFLQLNVVNQSMILKVGDFSQASVYIPTESADEMTPLVNSSNEANNFLLNDLQATARIVFAMLTGRECHEMITMEDISQLRDIEFGVFILALQKGMPAAESFWVAPFHSAEERKSIIGELNALFKGIKKHRKSSAILTAAESNASLVIGGKGAWSKHFELVVMEEFALGFNGYNITSFVDLLRIIRNILEHGHENPKSMMTAFKTKKPQPEQILSELSSRFPFFYLHSLLCFFKLFTERSRNISEIYIKTLENFENFMNCQGLANGALIPLQEKSLVFIHYKSLSLDKQEIITLDNTRSFVKLNNILPDITAKMRHFFRDISIHDVLFKHHNRILPNPFANESQTSSTTLVDFSVTSQVSIPEGSTIEILNPELKVQLRNQNFTMNFKSTDKVKVIKGQAMMRLPQSISKKIKFNSIGVTLNGKKLKDNERIVDLEFSSFTFITRFPDPTSSLLSQDGLSISSSTTHDDDGANMDIGALFLQPQLVDQVGLKISASQDKDSEEGVTMPINMCQ